MSPPLRDPCFMKVCARLQFAHCCRSTWCLHATQTAACPAARPRTFSAKGSLTMLLPSCIQVSSGIVYTPKGLMDTHRSDSGPKAGEPRHTSSVWWDSWRSARSCSSGDSRNILQDINWKRLDSSSLLPDGGCLAGQNLAAHSDTQTRWSRAPERL